MLIKIATTTTNATTNGRTQVGQSLPHSPITWSKREAIEFSKHTYTKIHIWLLQPFSQDYDLASRTTNVVCFNFIHKWRDLKFYKRLRTTDFWEVFHSNFICSQNFCQKSAEQRNIFILPVLMNDLGFELGRNA